MKTLAGKLSSVERFDTSTFGNPRYIAVIDGEVFYTGVNSSMGYSISNYVGKNVSIEWGIKRGKKTIVDICEVKS